MKVRLTQRYIDDPPAVPSGKAKVEHCDKALPGLLWEQRTANQEWGSYRLRYKSNGRTAYVTLGRSCDITLADARQKAKQLKAEIQLGADPQANVREKRKGMTWDTFFEEHYLPHAKQHLRSWKNLDDMNRLRISKRFGHLRLDRIRKGEVQKFLNELKASGLSAATCDHHGKLLRQALGCAIQWEHLTGDNNLNGIRLFNEDNQVERYLDGKELQTLLAVLKADKNKTVANIVLFLLSTGVRKETALQAKWSQLDRLNRTWQVPALISKSKKRHTVILNDIALEVLDRLGSEGKSDYLFVSSRTGKRLTTISKVWNRIRNEAGMPDLRLHDLRHSYASFLANSGCNEFQIQQALNHASTVTTRRYVHMSQESMQQAASAASDKITEALKAND